MIGWDRCADGTAQAVFNAGELDSLRDGVRLTLRLAQRRQQEMSMLRPFGDDVDFAVTASPPSDPMWRFITGEFLEGYTEEALRVWEPAYLNRMLYRMYQFQTTLPATGGGLVRLHNDEQVSAWLVVLHTIRLTFKFMQWHDRECPVCERPAEPTGWELSMRILTNVADMLHATNTAPPLPAGDPRGDEH